MTFAYDTERLGQHFLVDREIISDVVSAADIHRGEIVLEIGCGLGGLTIPLLQTSKKVIAVEIDRRLYGVLKDISRKHRNIEIIFGNILDIPLPHFDKLVSNPPYMIIEPLLDRLTGCSFVSAVIVAGTSALRAVHGLNAQEGMRKLTLLIHCFYNAELIRRIPASAFRPEPRTDACILRLTPKGKHLLLGAPVLFLFRELLEQRDKKLKNALREAIIRLYQGSGRTMTKRLAKMLIAHAGIEESIMESYCENLRNSDLQELFVAFGEISDGFGTKSPHVLG